MSTNYAICKAKGGIANCRYHKNVTRVNASLVTLTAKLGEGANEALLDKYFNLRSQQDALLTLIKVSEYDELQHVTDEYDVAVSNEMKLLLKRLDRQPAEKVDWTEYVKAAVTYTNAQSYGAKAESLYRRKLGYEKIAASAAQGDAKDPKTGKFMEVKFSVMSAPRYEIDLVQIRPHHVLDEYHVIAFDKDTATTEFYLLSKDEMAVELAQTGQSLAHGTRGTAMTLPEYAIRFKKNSPVYDRWQRYRHPVTWL